MKRQTQLRGERYWAGDDLIDLQAEPLKALDAIFAPYPACIISGCVATPHQPNIYAVTPGYVSLKGTDHNGQQVSLVVPFAGVASTGLPLYLSLKYEAVNDLYGDGMTKAIAYNYTAQASIVQPSVPCLEISATAKVNFTDVLQDALHRFMTDSQRDTWNAKETPSGAQAKANDALADAKTYANAKITELLNSAPAALDTLKELAAALGDDPNFATSMATLIGGKVDKVNGKQLSTHDYSTADKLKNDVSYARSYTAIAGRVAFTSDNGVIPSNLLTKFKGDFVVELRNDAEMGYIYRVTHSLNKAAYIVHPTRHGSLADGNGYFAIVPVSTTITTQANNYFDLAFFRNESTAPDSVRGLFSAFSFTIGVF